MAVDQATVNNLVKNTRIIADEMVSVMDTVKHTLKLYDIVGGNTAIVATPPSFPFTAVTPAILAAAISALDALNTAYNNNENGLFGILDSVPTP